MTYNAKDIYLERSTGTNTFEEYPLRSRPNCVVVTDTTGSISLVSTASFSGGGGSASFNGTASAIFVTTDVLSSVQVGSNIPLYLSSDWPALGFNAFFNGNVGTGWAYGTGSNNNYSMMMTFDYTNGFLAFWAPSTTGSSGQSWPDENVMFAITTTGIPVFPQLPAGVLINGMGVTSSFDLTPYNFSASYAVSASYAPTQLPDITDINDSGAYVGIGQTNPQYTLDVGGDIGNSITHNYFISSNSYPSALNAFGGGVGIGLGVHSLVNTLDVNGNVSCSVITASLISTISSSNVPLNQTSASAWMPIVVNGQTYYIPLYQ